MSWRPEINIPYYFTPTIYTYHEKRKAEIKNYNLPFLQWIYNGDELSPLRCLISGDLGWKKIPCFVTNEDKLRFNIDFNHIRQQQSYNKSSGISIDKGKYDPSAVFRGFKLNRNFEYLSEFMCIMPVSQEMHCYISQDSAKGNITLAQFPAETWPWFLRDSANFASVCDKFGLNYQYHKFIDHLSDIKHPSIHLRYNELA